MKAVFFLLLLGYIVVESQWRKTKVIYIIKHIRAKITVIIYNEIIVF